MTDVRAVAYEALLLADESRGCRLSTGDVLDRYSYLDRADRNFLKRLIEGTIERRITIDHVLDLFSSVPVRRMKKQIRTALRMGTYQLLYMESVPDHAAVSETVGLVKKKGLSKLSGFVNGIMRNIARNRDNISWPDREADPVKFMSVFYSCPEWIVRKLIDESGEENALSLLKVSVSDRPISARINLSKASAEDIISGCSCRPSGILDCAVILEDTDDIRSLTPFVSGRIFIQDISSMLVCIAAGIREDDTVLDLCAAPGGKSLHAADMAVKGHVISCDVSADKVEKINENIQRCGFSNISTRVSDATVFDETMCDMADVVIADVPCSGLGVMGRKNDIKYNISEEAVASLAKLQRRIVDNAVRYVKPGGILMYSTCTCSRAENTDNMNYLIKEHGLSPVDFYDTLPERLKNDTAREGYLQLYGADGLTDGFFIGKLKKHE